ncbi:Hypothetical predicted protein [Cloeon dipterum]|uniref:Uncharacterized protein n=1 Tax=Cloeon dipterum TaxID=197152 RepID=A0A8S1C3F3_9INSE|nr:Hypothetical predicted protein [Cloeon dipterum]
MPGNPIVEAKRKKRSHSVASQCSIGIQGQHLPGSRRQSKYTLQEQHSRQDDTDVDYKQRRMVLVISLFAAGLFVAAVLLIVVTLLLTPSIDERRFLKNTKNDSENTDFFTTFLEMFEEEMRGRPNWLAVEQRARQLFT